jgi:hypothetical protein
MHSRATDRRSASKCQGKWPDQTLDQAFGLPEVLVAVSTSRLSCKRAGKTRTLMPVWDSSGESRSMPSSETSLHAKRKAAAEASGGFSADFLYDKCEEIIREHCLSGSILDFGAGQGFLTRRLIHMNRFSSIAAADILPKPFDMPPEVLWIDADLDESLAEPDESFDVVVCCESSIALKILAPSHVNFSDFSVPTGQ